MTIGATLIIEEQLSGSPRTLTIQDYTTLTNGKFHFARKFDMNQDAEIMDKLDALIFN